jgi:hypothetical protein
MAGINTKTKVEALRKGPEPRLTGKILVDADDGVIMQAGGCIIEIPRQSILQRAEKREEGEETELVLDKDAEIVVSLLISAEKGFVADNVFGALVPSFLDSNCNCNCVGSNCNCNCGGGGGGGSVEQIEPVNPTGSGFFGGFRRPFTGGAKR